MKKEEDKRLIIPKDAFEEEASEGLGKLNREEAEEDLRELRERIERRVRRSRMIWLPAAAAVVILLVTSTVYIALFRNRSKPVTEMAMAEETINDTALIAMAEPIIISQSKPVAPSASSETASKVMPGQDAYVRETKDKLVEDETVHDMIVEDTDNVVAVVMAEDEEAVAEEVVVEAMPKMDKAAMPGKKEKVADVAEARPVSGTGAMERQAAPVGGMAEFNKWIDRNITYPEDIVPRLRQVVVVTFRVAADSTVYDLKAERPADERFIAEAFRLLRTGPKWFPVVHDGRVVPEEVRLSIAFK